MITLRKTWAEYQSIRTMTEKTRKDHGSKLNTCVGDWLDVDMAKITKDMVQTRHKSLGKTPIQANSAMRVVKTLYNFALEKYDDEDDNPILKRNPVKILSALKCWYPEKPRTRKIPPKRLKDWFSAVLMMKNTTIRDYLILCLLTGFRKTEAMQLRWENIDFDERTMYLPKTKNGHPHKLPMSNYVFELLSDRSHARVNEFVFPGGRHKYDGPMASPDKQIKVLREQLGMHFSSHDLRRTFQDYAEDLEISEYMRKRLMNHSFGDVTGKHYSTPKVDKMREPIEAISQYVLKLAGLSG